MSPSHAASALFVYDGDCGLCTATVDWLSRRGASGILAFVPSAVEPAEMRAAGITIDDCVHAAYVIAPDGGIHRGAGAINYALVHLPGWRNAWLRWLGWVYRLPGVAQIEDWGYRHVARHRHHVRVGPKVCAVPPPQDQ